MSIAALFFGLLIVGLFFSMLAGSPKEEKLD
jgi:hypothetical protein